MGKDKKKKDKGKKSKKPDFSKGYTGTTLSWPRADLNDEQIKGLGHFFQTENLGEEVKIEIYNGQLVVNGTFLHEDGTWATFAEDKGPRDTTLGPV